MSLYAIICTHFKCYFAHATLKTSYLHKRRLADLFIFTVLLNIDKSLFEIPRLWNKQEFLNGYRSNYYTGVYLKKERGLYMTAKIIFASNTLGIINDDQLQSMLDKFNLGKIISFKKTANGAMGQTMFVSSTEGDFVLKETHYILVNWLRKSSLQKIFIKEQMCLSQCHI